jgi:hypothetical protein
MAIDPNDQAQLNLLTEEYVRLLRQVDGLSEQNARAMAQTAIAAGNLNNSVIKLRKELNDTLYASDSLAKSFRESLAELNNQNISLQVGKTIFKDLTNIAQDLSYFQRGIIDLEDKHFRKKQQSLKISENNLQDLKNQLGTLNKTTGLVDAIYNREGLLSRLQTIKAQKGVTLTTSQAKLLKQLEKEKDLLDAANNALEEGLPTLQRELDISKKIYDVREDLGGLAGAAAATISQYGGDLARFLKIDDALESTKKYNQDIINDALTSETVSKRIAEFTQNRTDALEAGLQISEQIGILENEQAAISAQIASYRSKNVLNSVQQQKLTQLEADELVKQQQIIQANVALKQEEIKSTKDIADIDKKEAEYKMAVIDSTSRGLTGFINKFKSLGVLVQGLGAGLKKALTDPITIITFFIGKALEANKQSVETGKLLGISADAASRLRDSYIDYANASNSNFVTQTRLNKAQNDLAIATGMTVAFREQDLETFSRLTELQGLSNEEASKIFRLASITGKTYKGYVNDVAKSAYYASVNTKQNITSKEALQAISKLSAGILIKFQGNTNALVQNVAEAKKLGLTLDQIDKVGESLLNWEQSIENELKAELLTGRQINLEKARYAALTGDQLTLTREIASQAGTLAEYEGMNVLAQRSLAEAFGLTRDEMSDMLLQQELINKYGDEAVKLTEKQREEFLAAQKAKPNLTLGQFLNEQQQQLNIQQKFNDAVIKLQEIIGGLVEGPLGRLLDHLANGLNLVSKIFGRFGQIGSVVRNILGAGIGGKLGDMASIATIGTLIALVTSSLTKGTRFNPVVVTPMGGVGGMGAGGGGGFFGKGGKLSNFLYGGAKTAATVGATTGATAGVTAGTTAGATAGATTGATNMAASTVGSSAAKVTLPSGAYTQGGQAFNATGKQLSGGAANNVMKAAAKQTAAPVTPSVPSAGAPPAGGGGNWFSKLTSKLNPSSLFKGFSTKAILKSASKIGAISGLIEAVMAAGDIKAMVNSGADKDTINQAIGKRVLEGIGGVLVGSVVTALVGTLTGGMGFVASALTYMGGDYIGKLLFGFLADTIGAKPVGEAVVSLFGLKPSATPEMPETEALAEGGTVLSTGIAQVDKGEVYLGKNSRETLQLLAGNSIAQTQYLKVLITTLLNTLNLNPLTGVINSLATKVTNITKPSPTPVTTTPTTPTINFDVKPFNDAVNKLLTTPLSVNIQPLIDAIKGINIPATITSNTKIDFNPLIDAVKRINIPAINIPSIKIDFNPLIDAIKGINISSTVTPNVKIDFNPLIDAIKGINISSTVVPNIKLDFTPLIDVIKGITFNPTINNQIDFTPLIDAINRINIAPTISNISPIINNQIDFTPVVDAIRKINIAPPQFNVSADVEAPKVTLPSNEQPKTAIPQPVPQSSLPLISDTLKSIYSTAGTKTETPATQNNVDIKPMVNAINEVKSTISSLKSRPIILYIDGKAIAVNASQNINGFA